MQRHASIQQGRFPAKHMAIKHAHVTLPADAFTAGVPPNQIPEVLAFLDLFLNTLHKREHLGLAAIYSGARSAAGAVFYEDFPAMDHPHWLDLIGREHRASDVLPEFISHLDDCHMMLFKSFIERGRSEIFTQTFNLLVDFRFVDSYAPSFTLTINHIALDYLIDDIRPILAQARQDNVIHRDDVGIDNRGCARHNPFGVRTGIRVGGEHRGRNGLRWRIGRRGDYGSDSKKPDQDAGDRPRPSLGFLYQTHWLCLRPTEWSTWSCPQLI